MMSYGRFVIFWMVPLEFLNVQNVYKLYIPFYFLLVKSQNVAENNWILKYKFTLVQKMLLQKLYPNNENKIDFF